MDWKSISASVISAAPVLGGALAGQLGAKAGELIAGVLGVPATPEAVSIAIQSNPDALIKLKQLENERLNILLSNDTAQSALVNATIQAEVRGEHWPSYSWRPFVGFCVGLSTLISTLIVVIAFTGVLRGKPEAAQAIAQLPGILGALAVINGVVMPILGIASWFRGKAQADPNNPAEVRG